MMIIQALQQAAAAILIPCDSRLSARPPLLSFTVPRCTIRSSPASRSFGNITRARQTSLLGLLDEKIQKRRRLRTELAALLEVLFGVVVTGKQDADQTALPKAHRIFRVALNMVLTILEALDKVRLQTFAQRPHCQGRRARASLGKRILVVRTKTTPIACVIAGVSTKDFHPEETRVKFQGPVVGEYSARKILLLVQYQAAPSVNVGAVRG
jgi:hypothetical protein